MLNAREIAIAVAIVIALCARFIDRQILNCALDLLRSLR